MARRKKTEAPPQTVVVLNPTLLRRNKVTLGAWLKNRRLEINRTLRDAATLGQCSDAWLCQLEHASCNIGAVQVESIPKLAAAYSLSANTVFDVILRALGYQRAP